MTALACESGDTLYADDEQETEAGEEKAVRFLRETKASAFDVAFDSFPAPSFWTNANALTRVIGVKQICTHKFTCHSHAHIHTMHMCDAYTCQVPMYTP